MVPTDLTLPLQDVRMIVEIIPHQLSDGHDQAKENDTTESPTSWPDSGHPTQGRGHERQDQVHPQEPEERDQCEP